MGAFLGAISIFAILICAVWLLVNLVKRRNKKKPLIWLGAGFVLFIVALAITPYPAPSNRSVSEPKEEQVHQEAKAEPEIPKTIQPEPAVEEAVAAPTVNIGESVIVGEVQWKVFNAEKKNEIERGYFLEPLTPDGVFLVIELEAELLGKESGTIWDGQFKVIDDTGRSFEVDNETSSGLIFDEIEPLIFEQIHPNVPKTGFIAFDIAMDATALKLRIEDARFGSAEYAFVNIE
ncbi:MAG: DUF4352 domain-containing protein [Clostridium sp.]|nr:DUF4352 domain-containing protein [Clostridium sp.]